MYLRHPVVISSLEEDFKKIGLLKEESTTEGSTVNMGGKDLPDSEGGDVGAGTGSKKGGKGGSISVKGIKGAQDVGAGTGRKGTETVEDEEPEGEVVDEEAAMAEAIEFAEEFDAEFEALAEHTEISFDKDDIGELEGMAESIEELPGGILDEADDSDDEDDEEDDDEDEEDDEVEEAADSDDEDEDEEEDDVEEGKGKMPAAFMKNMKGKAKGKGKDADCESVDSPKAESAAGAGKPSVENSSVTEAAFKRMATGGKKAAGSRAFAKWKRSNPGSARKKAMRDRKYHAKSAIKNRLKRLRKTSRKGFRRMASSLDIPMANLLDRIESVIEAQAPETEDMGAILEGFASIAETAEQLRRLFTAATGINEELSGTAQTFADLAEEAATVIENLQNEELEVDLDELQELFQSYVDVLTDGMTAYADLDETFEFGEETPEEVGKEENAA